MNQLLTEKVQIASGFVPISMAAGANAGDWVSLKNFLRCAIVFFKAAGTAGDDPVITLLQATSVAGSNSKALNFTRIDSKQGAALTAIGQFTKTEQAAGNTYSNLTLAETQAIIVIDIKAEDLDIDNGFDCLQASVADVGTNAQIGGLLYLLHDPKFVDEAGLLPSAIAN